MKIDFFVWFILSYTSFFVFEAFFYKKKIKHRNKKKEKLIINEILMHIKVSFNVSIEKIIFKKTAIREYMVLISRKNRVLCTLSIEFWGKRDL